MFGTGAPNVQCFVVYFEGSVCTHNFYGYDSNSGNISILNLFANVLVSTCPIFASLLYLNVRNLILAASPVLSYQALNNGLIQHPYVVKESAIGMVCYLDDHSNCRH